MTSAKSRKKVQRDPLVMFLAGLVWLMGLIITVLGVIFFSTDGWWWSVSIILSGLSSLGFSSMTIVTGKREWLLIDLLLPG